MNLKIGYDTVYANSAMEKEKFGRKREIAEIGRESCQTQQKEKTTSRRARHNILRQGWFPPPHLAYNLNLHVSEKKHPMKKY